MVESKTAASGNTAAEEIPAAIFSGIHKVSENGTRAATKPLIEDLLVLKEENLETERQLVKPLKPLIEEVLPKPLDPSLKPSKPDETIEPPPEGVGNGESQAISSGPGKFTCAGSR